MRNVNNITKIVDYDCLNVEKICNTAYQDYTYYCAYLLIEFKLDGKKYTAELQTGHRFAHEEYTMPSNILTLYSINNDTSPEFTENPKFLRVLKKYIGKNITKFVGVRKLKSLVEYNKTR